MLFGSSGIRTVYSKNLVLTVMKVGLVLGHPGAKVLVGRDARNTCPVLECSLISGILAAGGDVHLAGMVPTPAIGFASRVMDAGCMITASHNPEEFNGVKIFNPDGSSFTRDQQKEMENCMDVPDYAVWEEHGSISGHDIRERYIRAIIDRMAPVKDSTMVLDCGNGAGCTVSPSLLNAMGISVHCLNCNPSEMFARPSEPLEEYLPYMRSIIKSSQAGGAVVHDGDADRMMAFGPDGQFISGDQLLMLFTRYIGAKQVVTTFDASMAIDELAEVRRTPVGDTFVSEELRKWGEFGGEPSGAWIFPWHSLCPDGPYAAALFCEMAHEWDIREEIAKIPSYPMIRESRKCRNARELLKDIGAENPTDGIRLSEEDGWCLVRASGTESKIRFTAEGISRDKAREMLDKGRDLVRKGKNA
ncbi:MAG TPA: phosphopentomutase/phosphoglucosamine mutase [Methanoregulaceae archaeon]|nr:phosphopentomutase/phosphoglucosamine mutase [Methanoregulaceae archaeon]